MSASALGVFTPGRTAANSATMATTVARIPSFRMLMLKDYSSFVDLRR